MRKFIILLIIAIAGGLWFKDAVKSGKLERYLDSHPNQQLNSKIEYYWAALLELAQKNQSSYYRYKRVVEKYPETAYAPLAWFTVINGFETDRDSMKKECVGFLEKYPGHSKAVLIRKKLEILEGSL